MSKNIVVNITTLKELSEFYQYCEAQDPLLVAIRDQVPDFDPATHRLLIPTGAFPVHRFKPKYVTESSHLKDGMYIVKLEGDFSPMRVQNLNVV